MPRSNLVKELLDIHPRDSGYAELGGKAAFKIEAYENAFREILELHPDPRQQAHIIAKKALSTP